MNENEAIFGAIANLTNQMSRIEEGQYTNNLLPLSTNPAVPENIRKQALEQAMNRMGFQQTMSQNAAQFENGLSDDTCNLYR